jgi:AcrR family transcriptional regulator
MQGEDDDGPDSRDRILMTAYEMLGQVPYQALTMDAIAKRVGVSKSLLFYHYGSKRELARKALHRGFDVEMDRLEAMGGKEAGYLITFLPELLRTSMERFNVIGAFIEVVDLEDPEDELAVDLRSMYSALVDSLEPVIASTGASHPRQRAVLGLMAVDMFGIIPHLEGPDVDPDEYAGALVAMMGLEGSVGEDEEERR